MALRAILLAAGRGERLRPYTEDRPKCTVELGGMRLIDRHISTLRARGIDDIVIVTGYKAEAFDTLAVKQVHNSDWANTNMVESLFCAASEFTDDMIIAYADIVYEPRVLDALLTSQHGISVTVDRQWRRYWELRFADPLSDAESLRLDERGCIVDIGESVEDIDAIEAQFIGLMRFQGAGVDALHSAYAQLGKVGRPWLSRRPVAGAYTTDLLMEMIHRGDNVFATPIDSGWLEIDTVEDLETANAMIENGTMASFYNSSPTP